MRTTTLLCTISLVLLVVGCENFVERADVENADLRALPAEVAVAVESYTERPVLDPDSKDARKAMQVALGFFRHRGPQSVMMGETIDPALFQETHHEAQRLVGEMHGKPGAWVVENRVAIMMLNHMIPAFKERVDRRLKLGYVRLLVDNTSKEFPTIITSLETIQDEQAEVAALARRALVNLQVLELIYQRNQKQLVEHFPRAVAEVEESWSPGVTSYSGGTQRLDVAEARSRLTALAKR